jgi:hypothetical protein
MKKKSNCENCGNENPKAGMKTCCRKCVDELKKKKSREIRGCVYCDSKFEVRKKDKKKLCSEECRKEWASLPENIELRLNNSKKAVKDKFGVDNVFQLEEIKKKSKETKKEKYGNENYNNSQKMYQTNIKNRGKNYVNDIIEMRREKFLKEHGVEHHLQLDEFKDKMKKTNLEKYGVENVSQVEEFKEKRKNTMLELYGVENASQNEDIKQKKKDTSIKNFGVSHHLKDYDMLQKHFKAQFKVKRYKDTELYYQGSYELYFLELMDDKGLLDQVSNGRSYDYDFLGEKHVYHTDFVYNGNDIEIKSGWTYNKNGEDKLLQEINETKWQSVINSGEQILILIDKIKISEFVDYL